MTIQILEETLIREEINTWAKVTGVEDYERDAVVLRAYECSLADRGSDWWICKALQDNQHKSYCLMAAFEWSETEEGAKYWREIAEAGGYY